MMYCKCNIEALIEKFRLTLSILAEIELTKINGILSFFSFLGVITVENTIFKFKNSK